MTWHSNVRKGVLREIVNHFKINFPFHPVYREGGYFYPFKNDTIVKPLKQIDRLFDDNRHYLEKSAFGVCQQLGEWMHIKPARIRMYFIYSSFITFGSPFIIYLVMAFWLNIRKYVFTRANRILSE